MSSHSSANAPAQSQPRQRVVTAADASVARFPKVRLDRSVTVAIAAYGNAQVTLIALRALFNAATGDFELLLVDDCSPDGGETRKLFLQAAGEHANTRVFGFARNLEYTGSLNCILSHARGERVLFVSNDIFMTPSYLRRLLAAVDADTSHGIVRGCSNFVDNGRATHNVQVPSITSSADLFEFGERVEAEHGAQTLADDFLVGDAFMVTRAVLDRIGTFDPQFYGYFGDLDFGLRARRAGFKTLLVRGAFAYHLPQANIDYLPPDQRQAKIDRRWARVHENWARFKLKYGLPVEHLYSEWFGNLPWEELACQPLTLRDRCMPGDYSQYQISNDR